MVASRGASVLVLVVRCSRPNKNWRLVYLMDEYMGEPFERTAINCIPFDRMLLVGVSASGLMGRLVSA